jgi:MOSC domain-containing protein YiiM
MGIQGNDRYFGRHSRSTGQPSVRQVSLMEREQIEDHARALAVGQIAPGAVRANIETEGIDLVALVGQQVRIGGATLLIREPRTPCAKMDALCQGLRARMSGNRQGVLAQVLQSGQVRPGDAICVVENPGEQIA